MLMDEFIGGAIRFFLMNFTATFAAVGLLIAVAVIAVRRPGAHGIWVILLDWFLLVGIGITYVYNGIMHTVFGELSAQLIGWEDNGFQAEVGFASLGMGILGIIASSKRMPLSAKFAALVVPACFLWGAAGAHITDIVLTGNMASHNAGTVLYTDILIPIIGFTLWIGAWATRDRDAGNHEPASADLSVANLR